MNWAVAGGIAQLKPSGLAYSAWSTANNQDYSVPGYLGPPSGYAATFSNQNRSVICSTTGGMVSGSSTSFKTSGQLYVEVTLAAALTDNGYAGVGIGAEDYLSGSYVGYQTGSIGIVGSTTQWYVYVNGASMGWGFPAIANGDIIGMAVQISGGTVSVMFRRGNVWCGQGSLTTTFPSLWDGQMNRNSAIVAYTAGPSGVVTINAGSSAFANAAPAGYTAWR